MGRVISMQREATSKKCSNVGVVVFATSKRMSSTTVGSINTTITSATSPLVHHLGTGMRAGVHIRLPYLSQHCKFDDLLEKLRLQKRGVGGVDSPQTGCIFDISNVDRLGKSELTLVQLVIDGINELIECEKALENGQDISPRIMGLAAKS